MVRSRHLGTGDIEITTASDSGLPCGCWAWMPAHCWPAGRRDRRSRATAGHLFESLVTLTVRVYEQAAEARLRHLRLQGGRLETDVIVERADQRVVAMKVKLGSSVDDDDIRNLLWLREQIGGDLLERRRDQHGGPQAYRRKDGVAVIPAALLGP